MPFLSIKPFRKSDPGPAWPDITDKNFVESLELERATIVEKGMQSGKTSIGLALKDKHGGYYYAETSAEILETLYASLKGAEQYWRENPE